MGSFGKCRKIVSDKGPNLTSLLMGSHCYKKGISHQSSAPDNPTGNTISENGMKIVRYGKVKNLGNKIDVPGNVEIIMCQDSEMGQTDIANDNAEYSDEEMTKTLDRDSYRNGKLRNLGSTTDIKGNVKILMSQDSDEEMTGLPQESSGPRQSSTESSWTEAAKAAGETSQWSNTLRPVLPLTWV